MAARAAIVLAILAGVCVSQTFNTYVGAPVTQLNYVTNPYSASTGSLPILNWVVVGTNDGKVLVQNNSAIMNSSITNPQATQVFQVNAAMSPVSSIFWISMTSFGFIANDTIGAFSVSSTGATSLWSKVVPWGVIDIRGTNTYATSPQAATPIILGNNVIFGSANTTCTSMSQANSTIWAIDVTTGTVAWTQSVTNCYSNYQFAGNSSLGIVIVRTSPTTSSNSWLLSFNSSTGAPLNFSVPTDAYYSSNTPVFTFYNWRIFVTFSNGYFKSYSFWDNSQTSSISLGCGGSSNMDPPFVWNNTVYAACSSYLYSFTADNSTSLIASTSFPNTITVGTGAMNGIDFIIGDAWGRLYWYFTMNNSRSTAFFSPSSSSYSVVGLSWYDTHLIVSNSWTVGVSSGSTGYIYGLDMVAYTTSFVIMNTINPVGPAIVVNAGSFGYALYSSSNYIQGTNLYYPVVSYMYNGTASANNWAAQSSSLHASGAIFLNTTLRLLLVWDTYGYLYGYNSTTGTLLFQSSSNCDISSGAAQGIVQIGDWVAWSYSSAYIRSFNWAAATATTVTQSCLSYSFSYVSTQDRISTMGDGMLYYSNSYSSKLMKFNPTTLASPTVFQNSYKVLGVTVTDTSSMYPPAYMGSTIFLPQGLSVAAYTSTSTTALWTTSYQSAGYTGVSWNTNAVMYDGNFYVVGTTTYTVGSSIPWYDTLYCFTPTLGISCGKTALKQSGSRYLTVANGGLYVFAIYNFTAVQPKGGKVYFASSVNNTDTIYVNAYNAPNITSNGFLTMVTTYGVYVFNSWTGALQWSRTGASSNGPCWYYNNAVYWVSLNNGQIASNPFTGATLATWTESNYYTPNGYTLGWGSVFGMQNYIVYRTGVPSYVNITGSLDGAFAPANTLWEEVKKNKLYIIGIVVAILVVVVVAVLVARNKSGGTGAKDDTYVSMNQQGGRV